MEILEDKSTDVFDLILIFTKYKALLTTVFLVTTVVAYLSIFFMVKPEYSSTATIIPSTGSNSMSGLMSLAGKFSGMIPSLTGNIGSDADFGMYSTIIYSRISMENIIDKFSLMSLYKFKNREVAVKTLRKLIQTNTTLDNAYTITCRFRSPELASNITNYLIKYLNEKVIDINVAKSRNDRIFLESRMLSVKENLKKSEDSLLAYQEKSGIFEVKSQATALVDRYTQIESQLAKKDLEQRVTKIIAGEQTNEFKTAKTLTTELKRDLEKFQKVRSSSTNTLPMDSLPKAFLTFSRLYREVEINKMMLEYLTPVFEQTKFDEQKQTPVLNVIDNAIPPIKRAYPKRTVSAIIVSFFFTGILYIFLFAKEQSKYITNPKLIQIRKELFGTRA